MISVITFIMPHYHVFLFPVWQTIYMGWVEEKEQDSVQDRMYSPKFLALRGSSLFKFSAPPVSVHLICICFCTNFLFKLSNFCVWIECRSTPRDIFHFMLMYCRERKRFPVRNKRRKQLAHNPLCYIDLPLDWWWSLNLFTFCHPLKWLWQEG